MGAALESVARRAGQWRRACPRRVVDLGSPRLP
ncbi:hypothetical protein FRAHR75_50003 [Frankia sp. Hr75.2]|nr:hypothetical protein FRAHR75_50003 [Frankia sp. Hr75.2]